MGIYDYRFGDMMVNIYKGQECLENFSEYEREYTALLEEVKNKYSDKLSHTTNPRVVMFKKVLYKLDRPDYSDEEIILQIMNLEDAERRKFERLRHKFALAEKEEKQRKRQPISEDVRIAVWRRDEGKCAKCGSKERLEYDHIIPLAVFFSEIDLKRIG